MTDPEKCDLDIKKKHENKEHDDVDDFLGISDSLYSYPSTKSKEFISFFAGVLHNSHLTLNLKC